MTIRGGLACSPVIHTLAGLALGIGGMSLMTSEPAVAAVAVNTVYAIASPVLIAFRRWWFVNAILSAVGMIVLLLIMPVLGLFVAGHESLGETQMLLILPVMIFPCALVLSGILRLLIVRRERAAVSAAA